MKLLYGVFLVLMVLVSACAQKAAEPVLPIEPEPVAPAPEPEPEPKVDAGGTGAAVAPQEEVKETVNEVRYVGAGGFEPKELTISAGNAVTWINGNDKVGAVVLFKNGRSFINSGRLVPDGKFEFEFAEAGVYDFYWNLIYGGKITVE